MWCWPGHINWMSLIVFKIIYYTGVPKGQGSTSFDFLIRPGMRILQHAFHKFDLVFNLIAVSINHILPKYVQKASDWIL